MPSESRRKDDGPLGWLKKAGAAAAAILAIIALVAWAMEQIRKPIIEGLAAQRVALTEERQARVAADSSLLIELRTLRLGQLYQLDAMGAPPESPERERILRAAKRVLYFGPAVPADSR